MTYTETYLIVLLIIALLACLHWYKKYNAAMQSGGMLADTLVGLAKGEATIHLVAGNRIEVRPVEKLNDSSNETR